MIGYRLKLSDKCMVRIKRLRKKFANQEVTPRGPVSRAARKARRRSATWTRDSQGKTRQTPC